MFEHKFNLPEEKLNSFLSSFSLCKPATIVSLSSSFYFVYLSQGCLLFPTAARARCERSLIVFTCLYFSRLWCCCLLRGHNDTVTQRSKPNYIQLRMVRNAFFSLLFPLLGLFPPLLLHSVSPPGRERERESAIRVVAKRSTKIESFFLPPSLTPSLTPD